jgi:hypothetical protein
MLSGALTGVSRLAGSLTGGLEITTQKQFEFPKKIKGAGR